jgi:hypothetical protein
VKRRFISKTKRIKKEFSFSAPLQMEKKSNKKVDKQKGSARFILPSLQTGQATVSEPATKKLE